jgi:hypothetical protein
MRQILLRSRRSVPTAPSVATFSIYLIDRARYQLYLWLRREFETDALAEADRFVLSLVSADANRLSRNSTRSWPASAQQ